MSRQTPPNPSPAARVSHTDTIMAEEKAAVKRSLAQEASFRAEKQEIVTAMGASPAVLLTPSADSRLQRKVGSYTNSRRNLLTNPPPLQQHPMQSSVQDDIPIPLDHSDEQEQYMEEDRPKGKREFRWIIGGITSLVIIGVVVGVVILLTGEGTLGSTTEDGASSSNSNPYSDLDCPWDPEPQCSGGAMLLVPACAADAYNIITAENIAGMVSWGSDSCDASHYGAIALAVAQTNYEEVPDPVMFHILATFYFAMKGQNWRFNTDWLQGASPCAWYGIECSEDGSIVSIELDGNNLQGSLPTQIGMFSALHTLKVGRNQVAGSIPSEIGLLSNLEDFSVFLTFVDDIIPSEIGNCQKLLHLNVASSMLTGSIPTQIGSLHSLLTLQMSDTGFMGQLPVELGNLSNLTALKLGGAYAIRGTLPTEWGSLTSLYWFEVSGAALMDPSPFPTFLTQLSNLKAFFLVEVSLTGTIPAAIGDLTQLERLAIEGNRLRGTLPTELGLLTDMIVLTLQDEAFVGRLPSELGLLSKLSVLTVNNNRLTGTLPGELAELKLLEHLIVSENSLSGPIPSEMCVFDSLKRFLYDPCSRPKRPCVEDSCSDRASWGGY